MTWCKSLRIGGTWFVTQRDCAGGQEHGVWIAGIWWVGVTRRAGFLSPWPIKQLGLDGTGYEN